MKSVKEQNLISIIIPVYNAEKYLEKCISSILKQNYSNIELILVNDGSTDNSEEICLNFQKKDARIKVIRQEKSGVSAARKKGIALANGSLITFVDSDDYVSPDIYKIMTQVLEQENCDIVECGYTFINEHDIVIGGSNLKYEKIYDNHACIETYLQGRNSETFLWNKLYKKELFSDVDLKEFDFSEDYLWNVYLFAKCKKKITLQEQYYYYLKNMQGACNKIANSRKIDGILAGIEAKKYLSLHFKPLTKYATKYILDYCKLIYFEMAEKYNQRKEECKQIRHYYNSHYNIVDILSLSTLSKFFGYMLFRISPRLYICLNNIYHLIPLSKQASNSQ